MIECQMYQCVVDNQGPVNATYIRVITHRAATTPYIGHCDTCFLKMYLKLYRYKKQGDITWQRVDVPTQDAGESQESNFNS